MDKKIYRYTNVELLDVIKNGQNKNLRKKQNVNWTNGTYREPN